MYASVTGTCRPSPLWRVMGVFLLLVFLVPPGAALTASGTAGMGHDPAVSPVSPFIQGAEPGTGGMLAASPVAVITMRPTTIPARQNRTSLLQTVIKNAAERPKVTVPAFWFILIVVIIFIGLGTILYTLLKKGDRPSVTRKKSGNDVPDHVTVIETPLPETPAEASPPDRSRGPAVSFPTTLEKKFLNAEFIGEGGLARVFRAQNAKTGRTVAVKVPVRFDEITGTHFTRDIVFWQGLEHENIIRIYSFNILPVPYIEMEYAPSSLAAIPLPLPEEKAVRMIMGIARGIAYAHGKGIVHLDIKPDNILIASDGTPKITDWGLSKAIGDTRKSSMIGFSPSYAAPEQIAPDRYGKPGPATDIYQIGMLLSEMLTGSVAFVCEGMHDLHCAILADTPVIPSWNGRHVDEIRKIILKCLAKRPENRYVSVADLISDLESLQNPV